MLVTAHGSISAGAPALTTTVPREYVHRAAHSEVFLTGWQRTGAHDFTITAQWPRSHSFYTATAGLHDPLMLCETVRQTFPLLLHTAYGTPLGHQLSWSRFSYALNPHALHVGWTPAELELRVTCSEFVLRRGIPAAVSLDIAVFREGTQIAVADTRFGCIAPAVYRRVRAERSDVRSVFAAVPGPVAPLAPALVGRDNVRDVVLGREEGPGRWPLRVDTAHPVLFDHPVDHVPGMVLLEAARQAAHAVRHSAQPVLPTSMDVTFHRYVEFDSPCLIEARPDTSPGSAPGTLRVDAVQDGQAAFTAEVTTAPVL
ncbi:ScbA/BarX family gamma-butyrolactone biosynthesis protein [Streptomyces katrae]|uniref:ScbA/BarX family gamma-butyrolactone biosynthesis protein n=1 Tax=Streptomyces katrae TaxID=68223 RepID=A0ABT7GY91_9ACTN|nr:ScbA/BarX family gamma-butyrolactone biosynthesis protein [Streptomyces katrae]MDK9498209.1 ScbA/BarX family gamma-butyrolactone biosynthesis protein [Streptomyces katrae]